MRSSRIKVSYGNLPRAIRVLVECAIYWPFSNNYAREAMFEALMSLRNVLRVIFVPGICFLSMYPIENS